MRYLKLNEVLYLHQRVIAVAGGSRGVRDLGAIELAIAQPRQTFDGEDLYPTLVSKGSALCHTLCLGHGFVDGNKRVAHAALEVRSSSSAQPLIDGIVEETGTELTEEQLRNVLMIAVTS